MFLVKDTNGEYRAKLGDFGFARDVTSETLIRMSKKGTPEFMSPEQFAKKEPYGLSSDMWALGTTLYNMLTLKLPFSSQEKAANNDFKPLPEFVNRRITELIENLLDKDPRERLTASKVI